MESKIKKLATIVGTRPQFIKAAVISRAIAEFNKKSNLFNEFLIHTGQHYDENLSSCFFKELNIPEPDYNLGIEEYSHASQVGKMMIAIEQVLIKEKPDLVLVFGDTNSTLAGALAGAKLNIPIAHIEAGLRSYNRKMAEEINRILTDRISTLLFCPTKTAVNNLRKEGINQGVHNVGDVMYDSILYYMHFLDKNSDIISKLNLKPKSYYFSTIHRAENTDCLDKLKNIFQALSKADSPVVLALHPRTKNSLYKIFSKRNMLKKKNVKIIPPISYIESLALQKQAKAIITDSGGIQKEAHCLRVPCITIRDQTEWVETLIDSSNKIVKAQTKQILDALSNLKQPASFRLKGIYGNGDAGIKTVQIIKRFLEKNDHNSLEYGFGKKEQR